MTSSATWTEISCTRAINGDLFSQGSQDYSFSIGYPNSWVPSKSYFRITAQLNRTNTQDAPKISDMIAFSDNMAGNLYSTVSMSMGGVQISKTTSFAQQASAIKMRSGSTYQFLKSIGEDCNLLQASLTKRIQYVSSDTAIGSKVNDSDNQIYKFENKLITLSYVASTGIITSIGLRSAGDNIKIGDEVVIEGKSFIIALIPSATTFLTSTIGISVAGDIPATTDFYFVRRNITRNSQGHNQVYALYTPPIGFWDIAENIGQGDYKISLNPNSYYKKAIVQSLYKLDPTVEYNVSIQDVKLYIYTETMSIPDTVKTLDMYECNIQNKNYASNLQFTIPSSTQKISVFLQHPEANYNTIYPPSRFTCVDDIDLKIKSIQLNYAGYTKTSTLYESAFTSVGTAGLTSYSNQLQQRFIESYESFNLGSLVNNNSCESYNDWLERGCVFHFDFTRDETDRDTELQLNLQNTSDSAELSNQKVFIVAWYRTTCQYQSSGGVIKAVKMGSV